jgi:hypothetical protein
VEMPQDKMANIIMMLKLKLEERASMRGLRIGQLLDLFGELMFWASSDCQLQAKINLGINKPTNQSSIKKRLKAIAFEQCTF